MLQQLFIQNFALIDQVDIRFEKSLSVITGETGAGKSILLGALGLILGNRVDHSALKDSSRKCIIEGLFDLSAYKLNHFFEQHDLDYSDQSILRREINGAGKSRSFINDTPCTLELMKQLGSQLIDIHSQQQSLLINDAQFQLNVLDALAGNQKILVQYQTDYTEFQKLQIELKQVQEQAVESKKQEDYLNFQFQELESLNLQIGENKGLEEEQNRFAHGEDILKNLGQIQQVINEEDGNLIANLNIVNQLISNIERFDISFVTLSERLNGLRIELEDVSAEIEGKAEAFEYDSERHQMVEDRLTEIHRLQQKHLVLDADELIELKSEIEGQLVSITNSEGKIEALTAQLEQKESELEKQAQLLRKKRLAVIMSLEKKVQKTLVNLGIPYAQLKVKQESLTLFSKNGKDQFQFLFSANKGIEPSLISKTASGGETSRLMLAIKQILADHQQLPTILFDEIDTGVSGEIAEKMGEILAQMGEKRQVISITHLPQLAAKGAHHYFVYKEVVKERSMTKIKQLKGEERVEELAKMLSGKNLTEAAMNNAKELLAH
ncbi:MAG: DNA repair protein RecN [Flavobacteriales bacterium]|nr:DNA repair protein RecN [Flavobacteriales bacterium]